MEEGEIDNGSHFSFKNGNIFIFIFIFEDGNIWRDGKGRELVGPIRVVEIERKKFRNQASSISLAHHPFYQYEAQAQDQAQQQLLLFFFFA